MTDQCLTDAWGIDVNAKAIVPVPPASLQCKFTIHLHTSQSGRFSPSRPYAYVVLSLAEDGPRPALSFVVTYEQNGAV